MDLNCKNYEYTQCIKCILDTKDDPLISFDLNGVCSHCHYYDSQKELFVKEGDKAKQLLDQTINKIKSEGKGKKYDCLIGLSGGLDSSYVAYLAHQFGLKALCVHFDNGWNSELAVMNIQNIVNKLGFDLYTYVIDWEEFKDLQLAYLKASVVDIEVLTDHAIYGTMYKIAKDNNIKYILGGHNVATEGILPYQWIHNKKDYVNIRSIHEKYGQKKLKTYPFLDRKLKRFINYSGIEFVNYLNWVPYIKKEVKIKLINEVGWRDYGGKHYESIWTRFYQGYILPVKFGIDKRKAHFSTLICSGQMTREEAIDEIRKAPYEPDLLIQDMQFVLKKLELTQEDFQKILQMPIQSHWDFEFEGSFFHKYPQFKILRPLWRSFKKITGIRKDI